jgi:threonine/homoserine/homoserine lactone efflux protein
MTEDEPTGARPSVPGTPTDPRPIAVSVVTTEHFALQGARAATISESTGRASMFLSAVSGGLVALGLNATATHVGTAFYVFGLALLPTLVFIGFTTFERLLQSGIEDHGYAQRIAYVRAFYFDHAPEVARYVQPVPVHERIVTQGLSRGRRQGFRTAAGMVAVCTSVLFGATAALVVAVADSHRLVPSVGAGAIVVLVSVVALIEVQRVAWTRADAQQTEVRRRQLSGEKHQPSI